MQIVLPNFDVNENEATITEIFVKEGDYVKIGDHLFSVENTKVSKELLAEKEGYIRILCEEFSVKKIGESLGEIYSTIEEYKNACSSDIILKEPEPELNATKKAIELAEELKISIKEVCKGKANGIVKTQDVLNFAKKEKEKGGTIAFGRRINQYDRERVAIIGAGKGAEIVIDIFMDDKDKHVIGLVDSYEKEFLSYSYPLLPCNVFDFPEKIDRSMYDTVILSIGSTLQTMQFRKELFETYKSLGIKFTNAIGNNVNIRRAVKIGVGNVMTHNSYVGTGSVIGDNNMISYGMNLGHHCIVGSHNLLAPGFTTAGCVDIGNECIIQTGVNTRSFVRIGNRVVLPVGYLVESDIEDGTIIKGYMSGKSSK